MSKDTDRREKVAPPRVADAARMANFMRQTGLNLAGSAKARRAKAAASPKRHGAINAHFYCGPPWRSGTRTT